MPAPKGNKNAKTAWYQKEIQEELVMVGIKIPRSLAKDLEQVLEAGQTKSEYIRNLIASDVAKRKLSS